MNSYYSAFGLTIASDMEFPELVELAAVCRTDLSVQQAHIAEDDTSSYLIHRLYFHSSPDRLLLEIPGIARFRVSHGKLIEYDPAPGIDDQTLRLYLLGSCMGAVFHQRKLLVLHATTIKFGASCAIFAGDSGIGKSTLAAALHQQGHQVLGDDLCVVDANNNVYPSYPQLKLWQDSTERLNIDGQGLRLIRSQVNKYAYPLNSGFFTAPLPIKTLYQLFRWNKPDFDLAEIHGLEKFRALRNTTYRLEYIEGTPLQQSHLKNCSMLANAIRMKTLTRPDESFEIYKLMELIDKDMKSSPK